MISKGRKVNVLWYMCLPGLIVTTSAEYISQKLIFSGAAEKKASCDRRKYRIGIGSAAIFIFFVGEQDTSIAESVPELGSLISRSAIWQ